MKKRAIFENKFVHLPNQFFKNIFIMSTRTKYEKLFSFGQELGMRNVSTDELDGVLSVKGEVNTPYEKNIYWDKLKEIGGEQPTDIRADIRVSNPDIYHIHSVVKGDTLGKIAKHYYKDAAKYMAIFNANTDKLKNPDLIQVGQELVIPNL